MEQQEYSDTPIAKGKKIKDVSDIFDIPKSALRYWEKKGLINLDRDPGNDYRIYSKRSIIEIHDFLMYRSLGICLDDIKTINNSDMESFRTIIEKSRENTQKEMDKLESSLRAIKNRIERLTEYSKILETPYEICQIRPMKLVPWDMDYSSMLMYLNNPCQNSCAVIFYPPYDSCIECISFPYNSSVENIELEFQNPSGTYAVCILKTDYGEPMKNDMSAHIENLKLRGFTTGTTICELVSSGCEGSKKYDYYKAMIEVKDKKAE